jgi:hypothetical protein
VGLDVRLDRRLVRNPRPLRVTSRGSRQDSTPGPSTPGPPSCSSEGYSSPGSSGTGVAPPETNAGDSAALVLAQSDGSSDVAAYSAALDEWQAKFTEDCVTVASYADTVYRQEQDAGGVVDDTSRLDVMGHLAASAPAEVGRTKCKDIATAYLNLVVNGS